MIFMGSLYHKMAPMCSSPTGGSPSSTATRARSIRSTPGSSPSTTGRVETGHVLETCVLLELERRGAAVDYVRTKAGFEVDFLARYPGGREVLIQACADLSEDAARDRGIRALREASEEHPEAELQIVTLHPESLRNVPRSVSVHAAFVWLLSPDL